MKELEYYKFTKEDIDYAIEHSWTYQEFIKKLKDMGYEVYFRADKISVRRYPSREEVIKSKIYDKRLFYKSCAKKLRKTKGSYYYCYLLKVYSKKNLNYKLTPEMRETVKKMEKYSEQIRFICKYKLETINDIENLKEQKKTRVTKDFEYKE